MGTLLTCSSIRFFILVRLTRVIKLIFYQMLMLIVAVFVYISARMLLLIVSVFLHLYLNLFLSLLPKFNMLIMASPQLIGIILSSTRRTTKYAVLVPPAVAGELFTNHMTLMGSR